MTVYIKYLLTWVFGLYFLFFIFEAIEIAVMFKQKSFDSWYDPRWYNSPAQHVVNLLGNKKTYVKDGWKVTEVEINGKTFWTREH